MKIWPSVWNTCKESLIMSPNIHEHPWTAKTHLRKSDKYRAAGSQTSVPSTWGGGALVWWFLNWLERQSAYTYEFIKRCVYIQRWVNVRRCSFIHNGEQCATKANEHQRKPTKLDKASHPQRNKHWNSNGNPRELENRKICLSNFIQFASRLQGWRRAKLQTL